MLRLGAKPSTAEIRQDSAALWIESGRCFSITLRQIITLYARFQPGWTIKIRHNVVCVYEEREFSYAATDLQHKE